MSCPCLSCRKMVVPASKIPNIAELCRGGDGKIRSDSEYLGLPAMGGPENTIYITLPPLKGWHPFNLN